MKKSFIYLIGLILLLGCVGLILLLGCGKKQSDDVLIIENIEVEKKLDVLVSDTIQINADFPFGCVDLKKYKYSKIWEIDTLAYGTLTQPEGKEFDDIYDYFSKLNSIPAVKYKPEIKDLEYIQFDLINSSYDKEALYSIDSIKYRLPDIGKYKCFYSCQNPKGRFGLYGNILLYDSITKNGKLVNVYYEVAGDGVVEFKYFLFDEGIIKIYNAYCNDEECGLSESFNILIDKEGKIIVKEIK